MRGVDFRNTWVVGPIRALLVGDAHVGLPRLDWIMTAGRPPSSATHKMWEGLHQRNSSRAHDEPTRAWVSDLTVGHRACGEQEGRTCELPVDIHRSDPQIRECAGFYRLVIRRRDENGPSCHIPPRRWADGFPPA